MRNRLGRLAKWWAGVTGPERGDEGGYEDDKDDLFTMMTLLSRHPGFSRMRNIVNAFHNREEFARKVDKGGLRPIFVQSWIQISRHHLTLTWISDSRAFIPPPTPNIVIIFRHTAKKQAHPRVPESMANYVHVACKQKWTVVDGVSSKKSFIFGCRSRYCVVGLCERGDERKKA